MISRRERWSVRDSLLRVFVPSWLIPLRDLRVSVVRACESFGKGKETICLVKRLIFRTGPGLWVWKREDA